MSCIKTRNGWVELEPMKTPVIPMPKDPTLLDQLGLGEESTADQFLALCDAWMAGRIKSWDAYSNAKALKRVEPGLEQRCRDAIAGGWDLKF